MSDTPEKPPNTIAQVGQMPEATPRPLNWRGLLRAFGVVVALAVIAVAILFIHDRLNPPPANDPVQGQQILSKAEASNLSDTTFTMAGTLGANLGGVGISTPLNGHGELTHTPQRLHLILSAQSPIGGAVDVVTGVRGTTSNA